MRSTSSTSTGRTSVTDEYAKIPEALERLTADVYGIRDRQGTCRTQSVKQSAMRRVNFKTAG